MVERICSERIVRADPALVHDLLVDIAAWRLWSPHIASTDPASGRVDTGSTIRVKPWFAPRPALMVVTWAEPGRGIAWESTALLHRLLYQQRIEAHPEGTRVTFSARVQGPLGEALTALVRPLSAFGQRRRLVRLATLAELQAQRSL